MMNPPAISLIQWTVRVIDEEQEEKAGTGTGT